MATVGRIHPHLEARVVDPQTGRTLPRGQVGVGRGGKGWEGVGGRDGGCSCSGWLIGRPARPTHAGERHLLPCLTSQAGELCVRGCSVPPPPRMLPHVVDPCFASPSHAGGGVVCARLQRDAGILGRPCSHCWRHRRGGLQSLQLPAVEPMQVAAAWLNKQNSWRRWLWRAAAGQCSSSPPRGAPVHGIAGCIHRAIQHQTSHASCTDAICTARRAAGCTRVTWPSWMARAIAPL